MMRNRDEVLEAIRHNRDTIKGFGVRRIGLFGSAARNQATASSDLDFLVEFEKKTFDNYMDLKFFLEDLFDCHVDLVMPHTIKQALKETILSQTVYAPPF